MLPADASPHAAPAPVRSLVLIRQCPASRRASLKGSVHSSVEFSRMLAEHIMNHDLPQGTHWQAVRLAHRPQDSYTPLESMPKTESETRRVRYHVCAHRRWRE